MNKKTKQTQKVEFDTTNNYKGKTKTNLTSNIQHLTSDHKGITLIALVITIIIMLILVGVTINIAVNRRPI